MQEMGTLIGNEGAKITLQSTQVLGWPGVYVLGCLERRVTIYSQQVRALNLAATLVASKRVKKGQSVIVVGAGVAGLTCAAGLHKLGIDVTVLEKRSSVLSLFQGKANRWLHPGVYDWPLESWDRGRAGIPLLDWSQGLVSDVLGQLNAQWKRVGSGICVTTDVSEVDLGAQSHEPRTVTWDPYGKQEADAVVLAVGFGLESGTSYWSNDDLDHTPPLDGRTTRWMLSGCGDGGLTDLFRLCIRGFQHEQMMAKYTSDRRMERIRQQIRRIEDDAAIQDDPKRLHDAYAELDAPWIRASMKESKREQHEVSLVSSSAHFLSRKASPLNRFLASQLYQSNGFHLRPNRVQTHRIVSDGVVVTLSNGKEYKVDRLLQRHGPSPALRDFPLIDTALASARAYRSDWPVLTSQTPKRLWAVGAFGTENRCESGGGTTGKPKSKLVRIVEALVEPLADSLTEEEPISSRIAETNASGYYADEVSVAVVGDLEIDTTEVEFEANVHFGGEPHSEGMFYGCGISARLEGVVQYDGSDWVVKEYDVIDSSVDYVDEDD